MAKEAIDTKKVNTKPLFNTVRVYTQSSSFETKNTDAIFQNDQAYKIDFKLEVKFTEISETLHEVMLNLTVTASTQDEEETDAVYEAQVAQAGRFMMENFERDQAEHIRNTVCPNILFPFAREAIVSLVTKAGFPAVYLSPINFDAVHAQRKAEAKKDKEEVTKH